MASWIYQEVGVSLGWNGTTDNRDAHGQCVIAEDARSATCTIPLSLLPADICSHGSCFSGDASLIPSSRRGRAPMRFWFLGNCKDKSGTLKFLVCRGIVQSGLRSLS